LVVEQAAVDATVVTNDNVGAVFGRLARVRVSEDNITRVMPVQDIVAAYGYRYPLPPCTQHVREQATRALHPNQQKPDAHTNDVIFTRAANKVIRTLLAHNEVIASAAIDGVVGAAKRVVDIDRHKRLVGWQRNVVQPMVAHDRVGALQPPQTLGSFNNARVS
jgi:hypothetical protein